MSDNVKKPSRFVTAQDVAAPKVRLLMLPFAGGNATSFYQTMSLLPDDIGALAYQMPGHGNRFSEPLCHSIEELVADLEPEFGMLTELPLVIFGHSLGGRLAFALCNEFRNRALPMPKLVVASASRPPDVVIKDPSSHLDDDAFIAKLQVHGGIPKELVENQGMRELFLPIIKNDMGIFERFSGSPDRPFALPVAIWAGENDTFAPVQEVIGWNRYFLLQREFHLWEGGHFFPLNAHADIAQRLTMLIQSTVATGANAQDSLRNSGVPS